MSTPSISKHRPLLLGSASPRRRDILVGLGIPILVRPSAVDELELPGDTPDIFLERVSADKLAATLAQPEMADCAGALVADTIVVVDGDILGKPRDKAEALELLTRIAGRSHTVMTRYEVAVSGQRAAKAQTVQTRVTLRVASDAELRAYAGTGEGLDKAGAYAIQGIGAFLVEGIEGSYTNVVGLPACEVVSHLLRLGLLTNFPAVF